VGRIKSEEQLAEGYLCKIAADEKAAGAVFSPNEEEEEDDDICEVFIFIGLIFVSGPLSTKGV
jgi:hypothetical protein